MKVATRKNRFALRAADFLIDRGPIVIGLAEPYVEGSTYWTIMIEKTRSTHTSRLS